MIKLEDFWDKIKYSNSVNEYYYKKFQETNYNVHLALMVEPYLSLILSGKKTIESRFSTKKIAPLHKISKGDIVVLKKSGGNLVAFFEVEQVEFIEIGSDEDFFRIKKSYGSELCLEEDFWIQKANAKYVTLIKIGHLQIISPIALNKPNRQSWLTYELINLNDFKEKVEHKIYCIAGEIASGKTTIANELALKLNGKQFSISDYLKYCLKKEGIDNPTRTQLQEKGEKLIFEGWENFCYDFLNFIDYDSNTTFVIDGIRHKQFFQALCSIVHPSNPFLVYLNVDFETLNNRKNKRQEKQYNEHRLAEGNLLELCSLADFVIDAQNKNVCEVVDEIIETTRKKPPYNKIQDDVMVIQTLKEHINKFNKDRGWLLYHNAMNLAMSINIEASELLEIFQWSNTKQADNKAKLTCNEHIREELADIIIYSINLANAYDIDISSSIIEKIKKNAEKYPLKNK